MRKITAQLPETLLEMLDSAAVRLKRSRAEIVRQAVERYLEDLEELSLAAERISDPTDPTDSVLDWDQVKGEALAAD